nr:hypothetical protein [Tanacetum cinerariifolium]
MYYPRFTKVIIHYFLTRDKTVSWRNKIEMHTSKDDYLINTLRFISAKETTQIYSAILHESLISPDRKETKAYKTYLGFPIRATPPKKVSPEVDDSGPIFDKEPEQKVQNDDHYDVFAIDCQHLEQSESVHNTYLLEQDTQNVSIESEDMNYDSEQIDQNDEDVDLAKERELLASLIVKLKCEIDESKNRNTLLETSNKVLVEKLKSEIAYFKNKNKSLTEANSKLSVENDQLYADYKKSKAELQRRNSVEYASKMELECAKAKDAQIKLYKTREDKKIEKVIDLENKVKVLDNIVYKTGQSVQTMNMLNNKCRTSFAKPEFLKKAIQANPRLYDIGCYNDNLALILSPESDEHDMCVLKSVAKPLKKTAVSESNKKPRNNVRKLYERVSKTCSWWYSKFTPSGYIWKPKSKTENVYPNVSIPLGKTSRTANVKDTMTSRHSIVSNTPLSSNSFAAHRDCSIHRRLWVLKANDGKPQASN